MKVHPAAELFPMMSGDAWTRFVSDIREHGQREPIVIHDGMILDGRNRWRACEELGLTPRTREWGGQGSAVAYVMSLNLARRHLTRNEEALAVARAVPLYEEEAEKRRLANLKSGNLVPERANLPTRDPGRAREQAVREMGASVSPRTVENAAKVLRDGAPELVQAVESGLVAVSTGADVAGGLTQDEQREVVARGEREILQAAKEIRNRKLEVKRTERIEKLAEIAQGNAPLTAPPERFPILYADPPWRYEHVETESRAIENQYPTMSLDDICALPVRDVVTEDAVLFLWVTSPKLEEGMRVVRDWGFTYRTCMVWDKEKIGMGYYARQQHELLFICTRGNPPTPPPSTRPSSVFREQRGDHSSKPSWFYEMIERMYPTLPKIEMFCRSPRNGWSVWGNQSRAA